MSLEKGVTALGSPVAYKATYDPDLLNPVPREWGRAAESLTDTGLAPFGVDWWTIYELSWLTPGGKPEVVIAEMEIGHDSEFLIESKSLKLYCNSFNMSCFADRSEVRERMSRDLSRAAGGRVSIRLCSVDEFCLQTPDRRLGYCLDEQATGGGFVYSVNADFLTTGRKHVQQTLYTRLFRSRCPVTGQPDWATVWVDYQGVEIDSDGLLRYLVSFREHQGFHEACIEKIYHDLKERCQPESLTVAGRFTRRGGIDINPVRSSEPLPPPCFRDPRQ